MMKFLLLLVSALFFIEGSTSSPINTNQDQQLYIATQLTRIFFVSYKK